MEFLKFKEIFEEYCGLVESKEDGGTHKEGQVREKFTEIADAVGVDLALLRQYKKDDGTMYVSPKATAPYRFPKISKDFVLHILMHHKDQDYQELRRGKFRDVPVSTMTFLVDGFTFMLSSLGHDEKTVQNQRHQMEHRLQYRMRVERQKLDVEIQALCHDLDGYENDLFGMNTDDTACFFDFVCSKVKELRSYVSEVQSCYHDTRQEELTDLAMQEAAEMDNEEAMLDINHTLILDDALGKNTRYQELLKEKHEILQTDDFVKNQKKRFEQVVAEMNDISRQTEIELFDEELPEEKDSPLVLKHPSQVLRESIEYVAESRESRRRYEEEQAKITPEEREASRKIAEELFKKMGWELPNLGKSSDDSK